MSSVTATATSTSEIVANAYISVGGSTFRCFITTNPTSDFGTAYNDSLDTHNIGSGIGTKTTTFTGLTPNTTYYVWIFGFGAGEEHTQHTSATTWNYTTTSSVSITGAVSIAALETKTIDGTVRIQKTDSATISGAVRISGSASKDISGAVRIDSPSYVEIFGTVNIIKQEESVRTKTIDGGVRINKLASENIYGTTRIAALNSSTIIGGVDISKYATSEVTGSVCISVANSNSITGSVRIRASSPEKLPEDWEYSSVSEPEEWNWDEKEAVTWTSSEKAYDEWSEETKDEVSWLEATDTEPLEWNYPLEDAR